LINQVVTEEELAWPLSAVFSVTYCTRCWPDTRPSGSVSVYFDTEEQLTAWLDNYQDWALLEGNSVGGHIETWDLGPVFVRTFDYN